MSGVQLRERAHAFFKRAGGPEARGESPCRPRSERIRGPEKSRATNGVWQRVISPRLRARRNNRFLFPSFAARDLPSLLPRFPTAYVHRESGASFLSSTRRTKLRFRVGDIIKPAPTSSHETGCGEMVVRRFERRGTGSWKFSHAHVSARDARGDSNDDRVEIRPVRVSL